MNKEGFDAYKTQLLVIGVDLENYTEKQLKEMYKDYLERLKLFNL